MLLPNAVSLAQYDRCAIFVEYYDDITAVFVVDNRNERVFSDALSVAMERYYSDVYHDRPRAYDLCPGDYVWDAFDEAALTRDMYDEYCFDFSDDGSVYEELTEFENALMRNRVRIIYV